MLLGCVKICIAGTLFLVGLAHATGSCTTVLTAAKSAYDSQINFMRRGLLAETTKSLYAEFIANLVVKAWETGPIGTSFGDVCIPDVYLSQLQDSEGRLLSALSISTEILNKNLKVPLMTEEQLDATNYADDLPEEFWSSTSAYIMGHIPLVVNVSRFRFPDEGDVRVDPYQSDACYQFQQKYNTTGYSQINADSWTANSISLVLKLIERGADATKALQLLKHTSAFIYVGMRCTGMQKSSLMIPTIFLREYARQSGALSQNLVGVKNNDVDPMKLLLSQHSMIDLVTTFASDGRLPETVICSNGHLKNISYDWTSVADAEKTFEDAKEDLPDKTMHYRTVESAINAVIAAVLAKTNDLTFTISRVSKNSMNWPLRPVSGATAPLSQTDTVPQQRHALFSKRELSLRRDKLNFKWGRDLEVAVRQTCGSGWEFFSISGVTHYTEQCCATICIDAAVGLPPTDASLFTTECCGGCSEYSCLTSEQAAAEGAAAVVGIELPPYGNSENESIPIMV